MYDDWRAQHTLDPDDGRCNSEVVVIQMVSEKVASVNHSSDRGRCRRKAKDSGVSR